MLPTIRKLTVEQHTALYRVQQSFTRSLFLPFETPFFHCILCSQDFLEIMDMIDKRLNDKGKNWRHVFKVRFMVQPTSFLHTIFTRSVGFDRSGLLLARWIRKCGSVRKGECVRCQNSSRISTYR